MHVLEGGDTGGGRMEPLLITSVVLAAVIISLGIHIMVRGKDRDR